MAEAQVLPGVAPRLLGRTSLRSLAIVCLIAVLLVAVGPYVLPT